MELIEKPIEDSQILRQLCEKVASESEIAVDTEFTRVRTELMINFSEVWKVLPGVHRI